MAQNKGFSRWWDEARPTKTITFWSWVASVVITMIIGFTWGGWVTGGLAQTMVKEGIVKRLAAICVFQFHQDPGKNQKLKELKAASSWNMGDYVIKQGWAKMPDEKEPDSKVAEECAKLLSLISP